MADSEIEPTRWVTYQLTHDDLVQATLTLSYRRLRSPWVLGYFAVLAVLSLLYFSSSVALGSALGATAVVGVVIVVIALLWRFALIPLAVRRAIQRQPAAVGPQRMAIRPEGLLISNDIGDTRYNWSGLVKHWIEPRFLLLSTGSKLFIAIPRRALTEDDIAVLVSHLPQRPSKG